MKFDNVVNERKSSRKFSNKRPKWQDIIEAVNYARKVPLAGNLCNFRFIIIDDAKIIADVAKATSQDFVHAHYIVVVTNDNTELVRHYDEIGQKYALEQVGAAIQTFMLKLTDLGLASCWVGMFYEDKIKSELDIPENVEVVAVIPVGYDADYTKKKPKPEVDSVLRFNNYQEKLMVPKKKI